MEKGCLTGQYLAGYLAYYANPVGNDSYESNKTEVTITSKGKPAPVKVDYPPGNLVLDKSEGNYRIYEGKVAIPATVQRAAGDTGPLEVNIVVHACDKSLCLPKGTLTLTVP